MKCKKHLCMIVILMSSFSNVSIAEYDLQSVMLQMEAEDVFFKIDEWVHSDILNVWVANTKLSNIGAAFLRREKQLIYSQLLTGTKNEGHNAIMRCAKIADFIFLKKKNKNEASIVLQNFMSDKRDRIKNIEGTPFSLKFTVNKDQNDVTFFCAFG